MPPTTVPTDRVHRRVCHALFDALEEGNVAAIDALYAPDMTMWFNVTNQVISRADSLAAIDKGKALHRRRNYDDRQIHTFDDGFMAQYTCEVVAHDGAKVPLTACLVAEVHDGLITRLWEYLDSTHYTRPRAPREGSPS
ncbi:MAG TPA: nuclear transport factor 2 family protein [Acidimicrobiales bacterium]|jgi:ketosteroid isomerase-like protein|nr:nuclear transport factor 2 family protein [Acidimicrobiales bacterium]